jgi:hypothetical protein
VGSEPVASRCIGILLAIHTDPLSEFSFFQHVILAPLPLSSPFLTLTSPISRAYKYKDDLIGWCQDMSSLSMC